MADGFAQADGANRTANLIRLGVVAEVDLAAGRVRVEFEEGWISDALPWAAPSAGGVRSWSAPVVGEQVAVLSPSGEPATGFALRGLFSTEFPAPSDQGSLTRIEWSDGAQDDYDDETHVRTLALPADGAFKVLIGGQTAISATSGRISLKVGSAELVIEGGQITLTGDVRLGGAGGKAIARHDDAVVSGKVVATSTAVKAL